MKSTSACSARNASISRLKFPAMPTMSPLFLAALNVGRASQVKSRGLEWRESVPARRRREFRERPDGGAVARSPSRALRRTRMPATRARSRLSSTRSSSTSVWPKSKTTAFRNQLSTSSRSAGSVTFRSADRPVQLAPDRRPPRRARRSRSLRPALNCATKNVGEKGLGRLHDHEPCGRSSRPPPRRPRA